MNPRPTAQQIIETFGMNKIPHEGPWFVQTYKGGGRIEGALASLYVGLREAYTVILGLVTQEDYSAMHRLITDEMWHFYGGDPLELLLLHPDGRGEVVVMGPDIVGGHCVQHLVPRGTWMGAVPLGGSHAWSLIGNTMSPGFEYADYEPGYRDELQASWPAFAEQIAARTRADSLQRTAR
jgi:uncharacterized protein